MKDRVIIDPETGVIERRVVLTKTVSKSGYVSIKYEGKTRTAHRVIWEHVHGPIPKGMHVDHINNDKSDNRISNLRLATPSQNAQNRPNVKGASFCKRTGLWLAQICHKGRRYNLGRFADIDDAVRAYADAAARMHTHNPRASPPN